MINFLKQAQRLARREFNKLVNDPEFEYCHPSHRVAEALRRAEKYLRSKGENGTFGVEGFLEYGGLQYLNSGDSYCQTLCYRKGRFILAAVGDIVER